MKKAWRGGGKAAKASNVKLLVRWSHPSITLFWWILLQWYYWLIYWKAGWRLTLLLHWWRVIHYGDFDCCSDFNMCGYNCCYITLLFSGEWWFPFVNSVVIPVLFGGVLDPQWYDWLLITFPTTFYVWFVCSSIATAIPGATGYGGYADWADTVLLVHLFYDYDHGDVVDWLFLMVLFWSDDAVSLVGLFPLHMNTHLPCDITCLLTIYQLMDKKKKKRQ